MKKVTNYEELRKKSTSFIPFERTGNLENYDSTTVIKNLKFILNDSSYFFWESSILSIFVLK